MIRPVARTHDFKYDSPKDFIHCVNAVLKLAGITQAAFSAEAGMDRARVNHYLQGRRRPTLETMIRLDAALFRLLAPKKPTARRRRVPGCS